MRIKNANYLNKNLKDINEIKIINERKGYKSVYHLYQFFCEKRDMLNKYLRKNKIDSKFIILYLYICTMLRKYKI